MKFRNMLVVFVAALSLMGYNESQNIKVAAEEEGTSLVEQVEKAQVETMESNQVDMAEIVAGNVVEQATKVVEEVVETSTAVAEEVKKEEARKAGRSITVHASAYSYNEAGLSPYTADGTNLRNEPKIIAVDPSVIPLGSLVEIPGYGVYRAADTGGAIKGNKIDIHMTSVAAMNQFGRRTMTIKVLN